MTSQTKVQKSFRYSLNVPLWRVFDATGIGRKDYMVEMEALDHWIAISVNPCTKVGHTMRTRSGHCPHCDSKQLGFLIRYDKLGEVYIAQGKRGTLIKIGFALNAASRLVGLIGYTYGGVTDWEMKLILPCSKANRVETIAHALIGEHRVTPPVPTYVKEGRLVECRELFSCKYVVAERAVCDAAAKIN
jgi:hypothetical protein